MFDFKSKEGYVKVNNGSPLNYSYNNDYIKIGEAVCEYTFKDDGKELIIRDSSQSYDMKVKTEINWAELLFDAYYIYSFLTGTGPGAKVK